MSSWYWDARYAASQVWNLEPNQFVVAGLERLARGRALDLGAGEGRHSLWLASKGWQVTAVDHSTIAIGRLQARAAILGLDLDAVIDDVTGFQVQREAFDLVLLSYLQLSLAELRVTLRTAADALTEDGRLFLVAHDASNLTVGYGGPSDPDVTHPVDVVAASVAALGLDVLRAEVRTRQVATNTGLRFALDHIVEAVRAIPSRPSADP